MTTHIRGCRLFYALAAMLSICLPTAAQEKQVKSHKSQIGSPSSRVTASSLTSGTNKEPQTSSSQGGGQRRKSSDEEETERPPRPTPSPVQADRPPKMEIGFRYWLVKSRASVTVPSSTGGNDSELGLDSKNAPEARWIWQFTRRNKLRLDYVQIKTNASAADINRLLTSAGFTPDNIDGTTELKTRQLRLGYAWQGLRVGDKFRVGPLVEWRGVLFDALTTASTTAPGGTQLRNSDRFGLATLNLGADMNIVPHERVEIASVISGITVAGLGKVVDIDNELKFYPQKFFNVSMGYRYLRLRADSGSNFAELRMQGPVVGIGFRF